MNPSVGSKKLGPLGIGRIDQGVDKFRQVTRHHKGHGTSRINAYTIDQGKGSRQQGGGYPLVQDQRSDGGIRMEEDIGEGKEHNYGSPHFDQKSCLGGC